MAAMSRRRFLMSATSIGSAALVLFAVPRAFAFTLEQGNAEMQALYIGHFNDVKLYHTKLLAELEAKLKGHPQSEIDAAVAAARCPICGLPIA